MSLEVRRKRKTRRGAEGRGEIKKREIGVPDNDGGVDQPKRATGATPPLLPHVGSQVILQGRIQFMIIC